MTELTLYSNPWSRGRIVRWMLEELGVPYAFEQMEFNGNIKSPDYLAINPMGKVPALVHRPAGGEPVVVTEVAAICCYLADAFPERNLAPAPGSAERAAYYRWLFFAAGPLEMATSARAFEWNIDSENAQAVGCGRPEDVVKTLEQALGDGRPYICGGQFSTADLVLGSYIGWEIMQKHLEPLPVFTNYVAGLQSRPAAKRADELDDALVKQPA